MPTSYPLDDETKVSTPENRLRRQFLKGSVGTIVIAALAYFGWTKYLFPAAPSDAGTSAPTSGLKLGALSAFPPSAPPKLVIVNLPQSGQVASYYVECLAAGDFRVLSAVCTHRGCIVGWDQKANEFLCPCHGAEYDITGKVLSPPAPRPLPVINTHIVGDSLYVTS